MLDEGSRQIEEALQANPEELVFRPNILTFRGELRSNVAISNWPRLTPPRSDRARATDEGQGLGAMRDNEFSAAR